MRQLIFAHPFVLAKYVDARCTVCRTLAPHLLRFANDLRFAHVLFVQLEAAETAVSAAMVAATHAPFMAAYRRGHLVHCGTVLTAARVEEILTSYLKAN